MAGNRSMLNSPHFGGSNRANHTSNPAHADQLSDLYSKGRTPLKRTRAIHQAGGPNVHSSRPPPGGMRTRSQDPAVQSQRFPMGGGTTPGGKQRPVSEPAEPPSPGGFDPME
jgi:hypothetical protein